MTRRVRRKAAGDSRSAGARARSAAGKERGGSSRLAIVPKRRRRVGAKGPDAARGVDKPGVDEPGVDERIGRVSAALYDLYAELSRFATGPVEDRERLRKRLTWSDVGHITSLARSLAEEDRLAYWVRFNGCIERLVKSA